MAVNLSQLFQNPMIIILLIVIAYYIYTKSSSKEHMMAPNPQNIEYFTQEEQLLIASGITPEQLLQLKAATRH